MRGAFACLASSQPQMTRPLSLWSWCSVRSEEMCQRLITSRSGAWTSRGSATTARHLPSVKPTICSEPIKHWNATDLMATVGQDQGRVRRDATTICDREKSSSMSIGLGAGVYDRCKEIGLPVRGINVGEAAASRENCARLRDELWFKGREWFQDKACSMPQDDGLIAELTAPTYTFTSTGKMSVESKADMKKRGLRSPDLADAFLLTFACGERRKERYRKPEPRNYSAWAV